MVNFLRAIFRFFFPKRREEPRPSAQPAAAPEPRAAERPAMVPPTEERPVTAGATLRVAAEEPAGEAPTVVEIADVELPLTPALPATANRAAEEAPVTAEEGPPSEEPAGEASTVVEIADVEMPLTPALLATENRAAEEPVVPA